MSGHTTINSVRAVLEAGFGLAKRRYVKNALWGFSGGALAGGWAAELQPTYAPELKLDGAALGGITPDILAVLTLAPAITAPTTSQWAWGASAPNFQD
ncbi:hypothetical protein HJFPF1_00155 [Paramyrothecium foliicola]|nr:hypothetical protein HJFPF1_00155 [Paramyrothecium foliicola]